jgi:ABC-type transport system involved in cytochrome c biogenesis ATPase subunit
MEASRMKIGNNKFRGIFVRADDPKFLERQIEPTRELLNLESLNVAQIRDRYIERQRNFDTTPFDPEGRVLRLFPGGYTVWSGFPGAGKTTLLRQLACHWMHQRKGVFIASLEEYPDDVFYRHACTALGSDDPSQAGLEWCLYHWAERLRLWSADDLPAPHQRLLAAIRVLAAQGVRHAIIDSLMCMDVSTGDWEGQRLFANSLMRTVKVSGVHIHLVAHPRKIISSDQDPDINDVAGAADIGRLADNVIFVRRSKNESLATEQAVRPMRIAILKQRHGTGACGEVTGWFNRSLKQFKQDQFDTARSAYLPAEAYREIYGELQL